MTKITNNIKTLALDDARNKKNVIDLWAQSPVLGHTLGASEAPIDYKLLQLSNRTTLSSLMRSVESVNFLNVFKV